MGLADLHLHTIYSYDGTASLPAVLTRAKQLGLDVIAITDHDEIAGALKALEIAPMYGVEVIPGIEITTAEGDLLALFIKEKVAAGLSLVETVLKVRELGGVCIAPHPMAGGMGMKSLNAMSASLLSNRLKLARTGSSDAHILETIGFGATEFEGKTAADLLTALKNRTTKVRKQNEWGVFKILGSWALNYLGSLFARRTITTS